MAYAAVCDLIVRFGERELIQLTDRATPPADQVDQTVAQQALDDACPIIDGYVSAKYAMPLPSTPPLLTDVACDIARYRLYSTQATELVIDRYKAAIETLRRISKGEIKIDAAGVEPASRPVVIVTSGNERRTTRDSMRGF